MGRKEDADIVLNSDAGHDFQEEDHVLNYRPRIEWVEPEEEFLGEDISPTDDTSLQDARDRVVALVSGYKKVGDLIDAVQQKVDQRVKSAGGLDIVLDASVDAATISAIKRKYPSSDGKKITYDMYRDALKCLAASAPLVPGITADDIKAAKADPTAVNFGGYGSQPGALRAELSNPATAQPIDLKKYQEQAVTALFKKMESLIVGAAKGEVAHHEKTKPHS
jgi:hypothetical protein